MFIKPNQGIKIRDPVLRTIVPEEGSEVSETPFWVRRVRDGDVIVVQRVAAKKVSTSQNIKGSKV